MMTVKSNPVELRGVLNKSSQNGKVYYIINVESDGGTPHALYCPDAAALPAGLQKGDMIEVLFDVSYYKGNEKLSVSKVFKVK